MAIALIAREIFTGREIQTGKAVLVKEGTIVDVVDREAIPAGYRVRELPGYLLAPALIDLQIYGGNGKLFSAELTTEALEATYEYCLQGGCTQFLITLATNSIEKFIRAMEVAREYRAGGGRGLLGVHLEGPYMNPAKKGAHLEKFIKRPTPEEIGLLLSKGKDVFRMMTLAPEQCDRECIELLLQQGIVVSAGHSNATYEQAIDGFYQGIPAATHLFNAMSPLQGRQPGMVGAIYDHNDVRCSIVCDGIHVDYASVRISKKIYHRCGSGGSIRRICTRIPGRPLYLARRHPFRLGADHVAGCSKRSGKGRHPAARSAAYGVVVPGRRDRNARPAGVYPPGSCRRSYPAGRTTESNPGVC